MTLLLIGEPDQERPALLDGAGHLEFVGVIADVGGESLLKPGKYP
jgi:hypothetical protein